MPCGLRTRNANVEIEVLSAFFGFAQQLVPVFDHLFGYAAEGLRAVCNHQQHFSGFHLIQRIQRIHDRIGSRLAADIEEIIRFPLLGHLAPPFLIERSSSAG